jgi:hypothetical protein
MKSLELTYNAAIDGYNLTGLTDADVIDIYEVRYKDTGPEKRWPRISSYDLKRASETDVFASGLALVLNEEAQPGLQLRVIYKAPFVEFATLADNAQTTNGLAASQNRIIPLGAAYNLMSMREGQRAMPDRATDSRRAAEVPPGHQLSAARGLRDLYMDAVRDEAAILAGRYPPRRR